MGSIRDVASVVNLIPDQPARGFEEMLADLSEPTVRSAIKRYEGFFSRGDVKQFEFICPPRIAASWTGSWVDVASGARMQSLGLELLTVRDGRFSEWLAGVSVWRAGDSVHV